MRLSVISDTHIPDRYDELPQQVVKELKKSDLIIHAGDFTSEKYYKELKKIKPLKAALGNLDSASLREFIKEKETFTLSNYKIGVMHGYGRAEGVFDIIQGILTKAMILLYSGIHISLYVKGSEKLFSSTRAALPIKYSLPSTPSE